MDMQPQASDTSINIPVTFDYHGGRSANVKGKVIAGLVLTVVPTIVAVGVFKNENLYIWQRWLYAILALYFGLFLIRFLVLKENYYSDIYETLLLNNFRIPLTSIWQIFDISPDYPYICYFKNGQKGIFVKMEKGVVVGKPTTAVYDHFEAISDAYNTAHSLNMDIIHIDYMDNVGNDPRLQSLYDDLSEVNNPDMQDILVDIYSYLQDTMSMNYASYDIYLFLTRDNINNFLYNVQNVVSRMLGGNFITYKMLDRSEISGVCSALFNLHDFSVFDACESTLHTQNQGGIIPIKLTHADGSVEVLGKTQEQKRLEFEEQQRLKAEAEANKKKKKRKK